MNVEIQETVKIAVTETSGAYISGATVTLGNQTAITGADGMVSFTVKRGTHNIQVVSPGYSIYSDRNFEVSSSTTERITLSR